MSASDEWTREQENKRAREGDKIKGETDGNSIKKICSIPLGLSHVEAPISTTSNVIVRRLYVVSW